MTTVSSGLTLRATLAFNSFPNAGRFPRRFDQLNLPERSAVAQALKQSARTPEELALAVKLTAENEYFVFGEFFDEASFSTPEEASAYFERFQALPLPIQRKLVDEFSDPVRILETNSQLSAAQIKAIDHLREIINNT